MKTYQKVLYAISWVPVALLHIFPLLMVWPFVEMSLGWAFLPVGLVPLGWVLVPIALRFSDWPKLLWLWGNDEEGCPDWWFRMAESKGGFIEKFPRWWWFAVRNPVNNFRFIFDEPPLHKITYQDNWMSQLHGAMEAGNMIKQGQRVAYRWAYSGFFAGYRKVWLNKNLSRYTEFWIGWKLGSTVPGIGFTFQYRPKREIGK